MARENCPQRSTLAFSPILRRAAWTRPFIAPWTTKITVGSGRFSHACSIAPLRLLEGIRGAPAESAPGEREVLVTEANPQHPSLQFKKLGERLGQEIWSARVTLNYRALAIKRADGYLWFWIGDHNTYDSLIS